MLTACFSAERCYIYARGECVFKNNPHIHKLLAVFLRFPPCMASCTTRSPATFVAGRRCRPVACRSIGRAGWESPFCFIVFSLFSDSVAKVRRRIDIRLILGATCCPENSRKESRKFTRTRQVACFQLFTEVVFSRFFCLFFEILRASPRISPSTTSRKRNCRRYIIEKRMCRNKTTHPLHAMLNIGHAIQPRLTCTPASS